MSNDDLKAWLLLAGFGYRTHLTNKPTIKGDSFYKRTGCTFYEFVIVYFPGDARIVVSTRNTYDVFLAPGKAADHVRSIIGE